MGLQLERPAIGVDHGVPLTALDLFSGVISADAAALGRLDAFLRQRGSLTVWFTDAAIAAWKAEPRTTRGGQRHYSSLAITTALTLQAVFRLACGKPKG